MVASRYPRLEVLRRPPREPSKGDRGRGMLHTARGHAGARQGWPLGQLSNGRLFSLFPMQVPRTSRPVPRAELNPALACHFLLGFTSSDACLGV